jgi:hypothetical protein
MSNNKLLIWIFFAAVASLTSCRPARTPLATPQTLPNLTGDWSVKMTQTGGIMGMHRSVEITSDGMMRLEAARDASQITERQLPAAQLEKLKELVNAAALLPPPSTQAICADCFIYDIQITANGRVFAAQLNDISLPDSGLEALINFLKDLMNNPAPAPTALLAPPPTGYLYHGVYPGGITGEESDITLDDLRSYEQAAGKTAAWVYFSHNWYEGREFPSETAAWIREAGSIPYIRLMLRSDAEQNKEEPVFRLQAIIDGQFDSALQDWCASAHNFGTPLLAEYGTEVNGEWFSWNGVWNGAGAVSDYGLPSEPDGPERFKDAYRHIIQTCREAGADNIVWVFHINAGDWPAETWNAFENYYPGDEWIDWIGVSIYGAQTPQDDACEEFRAGMDALYPRLQALTASKPIFIAEFGAAKNNPLCDQVEWARAALNDITAFRWPRLIGFSWWNEWWQNDDNPAHDTTMRLQDNPALAAVFREMAGKNAIVLGRPTSH